MIIVEIFKMLGFIIAGIFIIAALIGMGTVLFLIGAVIFEVLVTKEDDDQHYDRP